MAIVYSNVCDVGVPVELSVAQPRSLSKHFSPLAFTVRSTGPSLALRSSRRPRQITYKLKINTPTHQLSGAVVGLITRQRPVGATVKLC